MFIFIWTMLLYMRKCIHSCWSKACFKLRPYCAPWEDGNPCRCDSESFSISAVLSSFCRVTVSDLHWTRVPSYDKKDGLTSTMFDKVTSYLQYVVPIAGCEWIAWRLTHANTYMHRTTQWLRMNNECKETGSTKLITHSTACYIDCSVHVTMQTTPTFSTSNKEYQRNSYV